MIFTLGACVGPLRPSFLHRLGLRFGLGCLGLGCARRLGRRLCVLDQLCDAGPDRLIGRELGLGVELEVAPGPVKGCDHGVVARLPIALSVEEVAEQKVKGGRLSVPIADGKGTCGALTLSSLQK
jgi:hypothetical protein